LPSKHAEVNGYFRLAEGFMAAATVNDHSMEIEVRRALSAGYYALLHVSNAWLAMRNVPLSRRGHHTALRDEIMKRRTPEAAAALERFFLIRKDADYRPGMFRSKPYFSDIVKFRLRAMDMLEEMRVEFEQYASDVRKQLAAGSI
jgi:hypothetical protein